MHTPAKKVVPPVKKTAPAKKANPSLSDLVGNKKTEESPAVVDNSKSSGSDNTNTTETVTTETNTVVPKSEYDNSGNSVTDNKPVGWEDSSPMGATTMHTPSENASTHRVVSETVYAEPAEQDDKGLKGEDKSSREDNK